MSLKRGSIEYIENRRYYCSNEKRLVVYVNRGIIAPVKRGVFVPFEKKR